MDSINLVGARGRREGKPGGISGRILLRRNGGHSTRINGRMISTPDNI